MIQSEITLKRTPLYDKHIGLNAKMVPFSGWEMPVQYTSILEEHLHTREKAGLFDICHMGEFFVKGDNAEADISKLVTCDISKLILGKSKYGFMLNEAGGIIDDLIVFRTGEDEFMLVVNGSRIEKDKEWIKSKLTQDTSFIDKSEEIAKIDLQGPLSESILEKYIKKDILNGLKRFNFVNVHIKGNEILLSRTGYTGEAGFELFMNRAGAGVIWDLLLEDDNVKPVGLGARDTLRLEMGYSLYGNDIDEKHNPYESNLSNFVYLEKDFIGKKSLPNKDEVTQKLVGFVCTGRRSARSHFKVLNVLGKEIGEVTSSAFSPCMKIGIGLCYLLEEYSKVGQKIVLSNDKIKIEAEVQTLPLYKK